MFKAILPFFPRRVRWEICQKRRGFGTVTPVAEPGLLRARIAMLLGTIGTGAAVYFLLPDTSLARSASTIDHTPLASTHFTPATLTSSKPYGPVTKQLVLTIPPHLIPPRDPSNPTFTPIWSVFIKDNDIQVERPYTPLEGIDNQGRMKFWIKRYPKGQVSRWLHLKNIGDQVELRGPLKTWLWQEGIWDEVIMVRHTACGTDNNLSSVWCLDIRRDRHHAVPPAVPHSHLSRLFFHL
jgi:hypothetical protein